MASNPAPKGASSLADSYIGTTIELIGDSGAGKTTQAGELAKYVYKTRRKKTILHTCDRGGYESIMPLVRKGILEVDAMKEDDDAWMWINAAVSANKANPDVGLEIFDSGTSMGDFLLTACHKADFQVGQQRTQKFTVTKGSGIGQSLNVTIANEAHYGVVQGFMLDAIRRSTWKINSGIDVLWTFALLRGEGQDRTPILGPKLCGKALTPFLPKEFQYTLRLDVIPQDSGAPIHRLYTTAHSELAGMGYSFGNIRCPLGVDAPPAVIEPASIITAMEALKAAQEQADRLLDEELGL